MTFTILFSSVRIIFISPGKKQTGDPKAGVSVFALLLFNDLQGYAELNAIEIPLIYISHLCHP
ncbi:MAG TPA: hypothetical protein VEH06_15130, partial [Candidatus Bathyarchaeia archaeon]|nr:hypothetical protein [Candidatus Bathyarchaeia archaeon]